MRWLDHITDVMDVNLGGKLREMARDRGAWCASVHGVMKSRTRLNNKLINLFLAVLRLCCCVCFSLLAENGSYCLAMVPLTMEASLVAEHRL